MRRYIVTVNVPAKATAEQMRLYIKFAISEWSGQFHYMHPLFGWFKKKKNIPMVKLIKEDVIEL